MHRLLTTVVLFLQACTMGDGPLGGAANPPGPTQPESRSELVATEGCPMETASFDLSGTIVASSCNKVKVACSGLADTHAFLDIFVVPNAVTAKGVVVFGSGGPGSSAFGAGKPETQELYRRLLNQGWNVVVRSWESGWWGSSTELGDGVTKPSCRYSELVDFIDEALTPERLVSFGISAGSSEVALALSFHERARTLIDHAIFVSGPSKGRMDLLCFGDLAQDGWIEMCEQSFEDNTSCSENPMFKAPCTIRDIPESKKPEKFPLYDGIYFTSESPAACSAPELSQLERIKQDTILSSRAVLDFPDTFVDIVQGTANCGTPALAFGRMFYDQIQSSKAYELLEGVRHQIDSEPGALEAILDRIESAP